MDAFRGDEFCLNAAGEETAKQILRVLCKTFADNSIIDDVDVHGNIPNEARSKVSKKMTYKTMQSVVRNALVLEGREILHPAALSKNIFLRDWKNPKVLEQHFSKNALNTRIRTAQGWKALASYT